jgi:Flp pilus assembly pilin Flp
VRSTLQKLLQLLLESDAGQTNVELGAILVFVSIAAVAILMTIGSQIIPMFTSAANGF